MGGTGVMDIEWPHTSGRAHRVCESKCVCLESLFARVSGGLGTGPRDVQRRGAQGQRLFRWSTEEIRTTRPRPGKNAR